MSGGPAEPGRRRPDAATIAEVAERLRSLDDIVLTTHITPDGDGLGSELAMLRHLRTAGRRVTAINCSAVPPDLRFLCRDGEILTWNRERHAALVAGAGAIIAFDLGGSVRLGRMEEPVRASKALRILIDHHIDNNDLFDLPVIRTDVCASAELTYDLILALGGKITPAIAEPLYVGVVSDTGAFQYNATTPRTHALAAEFLRAGVNPHRIWRKLNCQRELQRVRILGILLAAIDTSCGGQVASARVDLDFLKRHAIEAKHVFDVVPHLLSIQGVEVGAFFLEVSSTRTKVSLRSAGRVDVSGVATAHGGGGHRFAAGCTVEGPPLAEAIPLILGEVTALVESLRPAATPSTEPTA